MKQCDLLVSGTSAHPVVSVNGGPEQILPPFTHALRGTLRWLIEDYPRLASGVAEAAAKMAEGLLTEFGTALGQAVRTGAPGFGLDDPELAVMIRDPEGLTRHWPWELLSALGHFATHVTAGVFRTTALPSSDRQSLDARSRKLRILSVISRPMGVSDVGFRAVARRMLSNAAAGEIEVSVLRPPTLQALSEVLAQAAANNQPYDVVHFDGHGTVVETMGGEVGAILFENAARTGARPAPGRAVANALNAGRVRMLLLNACHSAQAPLVKPADGGDGPAFGSRALASFAEEVASSSQVDVVAMSHQLSVSNAVHIVDDLYRCLAAGSSLPEAVRYARRRWIDAEPSPGSSLGHVILRAFINQPGPPRLNHWPEYGPPRLANLTTAPAPGMAAAFQDPPALFGTDDTILTLDRAFDDAAPMLLTGLRGAGKSETAREFARWLVASGRLESSEISILDLRVATQPDDAITQIANDDHSLLIVEHGEDVHGDSFQDRAPWQPEQIAQLSEVMTARAVSGKQTLVLAHAPVPGLESAREIPMRPLELEDLRAFSQSAVGEPLSDFVLLWTAGHPAATLTLFEYWRAGNLSGPDATQVLLRQLRNGQFSDENLPREALAPLIFKTPDIASEEIAPMWLLMQFQGRMVFPAPEIGEDVDELAHSFGRPYFAIFAQSARPERLLGKLKYAGLIAEPVPGTFLLHPLFAAVIPHPYNCDPYRTEDALNLLHAAKAFMAQYAWLVSGETSKFVPEMGRSHPAWHWHLHTVQNAWYSISGDDLTLHDYVLKLGRKARVMLEKLPDPTARAHLIQRMAEVFDTHPFGETGEDQRLALNWANEQLSIALADQNSEKAQALSHLVSALEKGVEAVAADDTYGSKEYARMLNSEASFDSHWKAGKAFAQKDPEAAVQSFASAFQAAESDMARQALAALEIARLTSTRSEVLDLETAEQFATLAYNGFFELSKANLVERGRVSEAALTASRIVLEIARRDDSFETSQRDGLSFAIMARDYASSKKEQALAAYNFGNWLRMLRKVDAAEEFIKAASLFEEIGEYRTMAHAQLLYGVSLFEREGQEKALDPIHQARAVFERLGDQQGVDLTDTYLEQITVALK